MSNRESDVKPPYPAYSRTPVFGGRLPSEFTWPPDVRPSALNPSYSVYEGTRDRYLAGLGGDDMQSADEQIQDYPNELNLLAHADDVQGNGIFDPNGSSGNIHADYGVFQDHESLPGYIVRDKFYRPSEVDDLTTGGRTMYVPAGAVALDKSQVETYWKNRNLWEIPPGVSPEDVHETGFQKTWNTPPNSAWPVGPVGADDEKQPATATQMVIGFAIAGLAVGVLAATLKKPMRKNRRR